MSLEVFIIDGLDALKRATDPDRWWAALERNAPRAFAPMAKAIQSAAPKGRTGKLSRGFDVRAKRISQGFIQGVQVDIGARVPYGHLVERGHRIIARGPGRKGGRLGVLRKALKARRLAGGTGFVPGQFFAQRTFDVQGEQVLGLLVKLLEQELGRVV